MGPEIGCASGAHEKQTVGIGRGERFSSVSFFVFSVGGWVVDFDTDECADDYFGVFDGTKKEIENWIMQLRETVKINKCSF